MNNETVPNVGYNIVEVAFIDEEDAIKELKRRLHEIRIAMAKKIFISDIELCIQIGYPLLQIETVGSKDLGGIIKYYNANLEAGNFVSKNIVSIGKYYFFILGYK